MGLGKKMIDRQYNFQVKNKFETVFYGSNITVIKSKSSFFPCSICSKRGRNLKFCTGKDNNKSKINAKILEVIIQSIWYKK